MLLAMAEKKIEVVLNWEQVSHLNDMLFDYTYWMRGYYEDLLRVIAAWKKMLKESSDKDKTVDLIKDLDDMQESAEKLDIGRLRCDAILLKCRDALGIKTDLDEDIKARRDREAQARNTAKQPATEVSESTEVLPEEGE